jgi:hypothetical protein
MSDNYFMVVTGVLLLAGSVLITGVSESALPPVRNPRPGSSHSELPKTPESRTPESRTPILDFARLGYGWQAER